LQSNLHGWFTQWVKGGGSTLQENSPQSSTARVQRRTEIARCKINSAQPCQYVPILLEELFILKNLIVDDASPSRDTVDGSKPDLAG
jgi:hypothetical protein